MDNSLKDLFQMVDSMPGNFVVHKVTNGSVDCIYYTEGIPAMSGMTRSEYDLQEDKLGLILEEDREVIREKIKDIMFDEEFTQTEYLYRRYHKTKGFIWVHMIIEKYADIEGVGIYVSNLVDVNKETLISYALMESTDRFICVIEKSTKRFLYANQGFYDLIDSTPAEAMGKHCYELLCKVAEMKDNDNCLCYSSLENPIEYYDPVKKKHISMTGREVVWGEYDAYAFYLTDITSEKLSNELLEDSRKRFNVALDNSDIMIWEYDMVNNICINSEKAGRDYNIPIIIENYPESLFETGHVPPESIEQIKDVVKRLKRGESGFSVERRTIDKYGESHWQRVEYNLEKDEDGKPIRAIICGQDITNQKELEKKYLDQIEYRNKLARNATFSIRLDLEDNTVGDYTCNEPKLLNIAEESKTAEEFLEKFFEYSNFSEESKLEHETFTIDTLKKYYHMGETKINTTYHCELLNQYFELDFVMYLNPSNNHIEAFYVIRDVTDSVLKQIAFQNTANMDYEFVSVIDAKSGLIKFLSHSKRPELVGLDVDYDDLMENFAKKKTFKNSTRRDYLLASRGISLKEVMRRLDEMSVYQFNIRHNDNKGDPSTYRLSFKYSDNTHSQIIFTRANITESIIEEQRAQNALRDALEKAKSADKAKTEFLSRMSHDMRTPMNTIIGLAALTLDDAENPQIVKDNMAKMRNASDFLLGLVNDILDMAKIEDESVVLKSELYKYSDFVSNIKTMIKPSCDVKGIEIDFVEPDINPYCITDKLRLNQIFFNIYTNAVKYTQPGGKITSRVENVSFDNDVLSGTYVIEDTGIGMSKEFQEIMFKPFTREDNKVTAELQGSGLGLSITKQLVELMGGNLEIESERGIGTKVKISLSIPIQIGGEELIDADAECVQKDEIILEDKTVLLVEDHPLNCQIAKKLLEKKGINVITGSNGRIAVDIFEDSKINQFDAVLMDIRMPEMSGIEATKEIRSLQRADAKSVPIIAMSANAYPEDIKKSLDAGMDDHLAKPIEPEIMYKALIKYIKEEA